jgi:short-subunit dehydrogenase
MAVSNQIVDYAVLSKKYPGKRAFITGAGSGLGLEFAIELARNNWHLALTDVHSERLITAAEAVLQAGGTPTTYVFDVADYDKFQEAVNDFAAKMGGIDIGINNAGVGCGGSFDELPIEIFRKIININLMGVVNGCHLLVPIMKEQRSGHILNVGSAAAFVAAPRMSASSTSKAGVLALSETLRSELDAYDVLVTVLMPTYVHTKIGIDAEGTKDGKEFARLLVDQSQLSPQTVVQITLTKMEKGDLYVVLPSEAKNLWRFKRLFPDRFWRVINHELNRRIAKYNQTSS